MEEYAARARDDEAARAKVRQFDAEFFKRRLPELRAVLPSDQRAMFDQNIKALAESGYSLFLASHPEQQVMYYLSGWR